MVRENPFYTWGGGGFRNCYIHLSDNLEDAIQFIEKNLEEFDFHYNEIFIGDKLIADIYIEDRAVPYQGNWRKTLHQCEIRINCLNKITS